MIYKKFVKLVEDHADLLTKNWMDEVKTNPSTAGYRNFSDEVLGARVYDVYKRLGDWLFKEDPSYEKTAAHYIALGKERAKEGLKVSEVIYALILTRVVMWKYVTSQGIVDSAIDMYEALEFYRRVNAFFDKAAYFVAVGFETAGPAAPGEKTTPEFIEKAVKAVDKFYFTDIRKL